MNAIQLAGLLFTLGGALEPTPFVIGDAPRAQYAPAIDGQRVVWIDWRSGHLEFWAYDVATKAEPIVWAARHAVAGTGPAISWDIVVWEDRRSAHKSGSDIYAFDLSAQREFPICTHAGDQRRPAVSGSIVVWEDTRHGDADIYAYDLERQREFSVCVYEHALQLNPDISGTTVVWQDDRAGHFDIYAANATTREISPVYTRPGDQLFPATDGSLVVWQDAAARGEPSGPCNIRGYDLHAHRSFTICDAPGTQRYPDVWDGIVVWEDQRERGSSAIYARDMAGETEVEIATARARQAAPVIGDRTVVWTDLGGPSPELRCVLLK